MQGTHVVRRLVWPLALILAACVSAVPQQGGTAAPRGTPPTDPATAWPIRSFEHIDLWLHGFAMLTQDTTHVPFFERGYRDSMVAIRRQRNAYTALDANREQLSARFTANPALNNAQFAIIFFQSFDELSRAADLYLRADGSVAAIQDPSQRTLAQYLYPYFRSIADREWLRLFMQSLQDERTRFYTAYWNGERNNRNAALNALETMWTQTYRAKFQRFLTNTRQGDGTFLVSMPLNGEGRTITSAEGNAVTTTFPRTAARAGEAIYVFAHEIVGSVVEVAIGDNLTPTQVRAGEREKHVSNAAVRGGALLLEKVAPELLTGYMQYYLRSARATVPTGDPAAAFAGAYPLPDAIRDGIRRQIDAVLGGI
jgi:hypothetical protein